MSRLPDKVIAERDLRAKEYGEETTIPIHQTLGKNGFKNGFNLGYSYRDAEVAELVATLEKICKKRMDPLMRSRDELAEATLTQWKAGQL